MFWKTKLKKKEKLEKTGKRNLEKTLKKKIGKKSWKNFYTNETILVKTTVFKILTPTYINTNSNHWDWT